MTCKLYAAIFRIPRFLAFFLLNLLFFYFRNLLWLLDSFAWDCGEGGEGVCEMIGMSYEMYRTWEYEKSMIVYGHFQVSSTLKLPWKDLWICFCCADGGKRWDAEIYIGMISYCSFITQRGITKLSWNLVAILPKILCREISMKMFEEL